MQYLRGQLAPYKRPARIIDVDTMPTTVGGKISYMFDITSSAISFIKAGKVRALAVTSKMRNAELPETPTMVEAGIADYEVTGWYALVGPARLPAQVQARLQAAFQDVGQDPQFRKAMIDGGYTLNAGNPAELKRRIDHEYALWSDVIKAANIKAD